MTSITQIRWSTDMNARTYLFGCFRGCF